LDIAPDGGAVGYGGFVEIAARANLVRTERGVGRRSNLEGFELDDLVAGDLAGVFDCVRVLVGGGAGFFGLQL
jgi:hypothetical protein